MRTFWITLMSAVADANIAYNDDMATAQSAMDVAQGANTASVATDTQNREKAKNTKSKAMLAAEQAYWAGIDKLTKPK